MKKDTYKKAAYSAEQEYQQALQDNEFTSKDSLTREEEILLIKSYAPSPSLDEVLWRKQEIAPVNNPRFRISGKAHGVIDYTFAAVLGIAPLVFGFKNKLLFGLLGDATALSAALTKDSKGLLPVLPLRTHRAVDVVLLSGLVCIATTKAVRKHKPSLLFALGMLAAGAATVALTDWNLRKSRS